MNDSLPQNFLAFTTKSTGRLREIVTDCGVSLPVAPEDFKAIKPEIYNTKALWDTGATGCVITEFTAKKLNLKPISIVKVFHAGGESLQNVYLVNIYLPNKVLIPAVRVTECQDTTGKFGVIVGMDIITHGDFSVTNVENKTIVSFRIPSIKTIDYVEEYNNTFHKPYIAKKVPGRNDLCPCGSGKKYKYCHGS